MHLVANCPADPRFNEDNLLSASSVFQNMDFEYEVNQLRPQACAARHNVGIVYSETRDTPSLEALRLQPDLPTKQMSWLQRHYRGSGDLYGILLFELWVCLFQ